MNSKENSSKVAFFPSNEAGGKNWKGPDGLKAGVVTPLPADPDEGPAPEVSPVGGIVKVVNHKVVQILKVILNLNVVHNLKAQDKHKVPEA